MHFNLGEILLHARCGRHPPATSFDRELQTHLVEALEQKMIAGAGFDVLTKEPPLDGNPLLDLDLPNFILTPHVAWASDEAQQFLADQLIDNVDLFFKGMCIMLRVTMVCLV